MFKRGELELDYLGKIVIALIFLVVVLLIVFAIQGKLGGFLDSLKGLIGGPR